MNQQELQKVLDDHKKWLNSNEGARADLCNANLYGADLRSAYLRNANLYGADLRSAYLCNANLYGANLHNADLCNANLYGADLRYANLYGADLHNADLRNANLYGADLRYANLYGADLRSAYLRNANLYGADLRSAYLCNANLYGVDLRNANLYGADLRYVLINELTAFFTLQCPEEGSFIGWKKCQDDVIVKLRICDDAKRSSATSLKCRASKVEVLEVIGADIGLSRYNSSFRYQKGQIIEIKDFDENRWNECSTGIHFFMSKELAKQYD